MPKAIEDEKEAVLLASSHRFMHRYRALLGASLAARGNSDAALLQLLLASEGYKDTILLSNLGHVFSQLGQWHNASRVYREWAETGIDHRRALDNLATAYEHAGDPGSAADALKRRMALWPPGSFAEAKRLAVLYLQSEDAHAARAALLQFERLGGVTSAELPAEYDNLMGAVLLTMGDRSGAERAFRVALEKAPGLDSARMNLQRLLGAADTNPTPAD